ncbi:MAG: ribonuclease J [Armatimonadota bacterium]
MTEDTRADLGPYVDLIPLGGVGEIGKNITAYRIDGRILVVDCGLKFPDDDMLGVDVVIPDVSFLVENADKIEGIVLTHGHEDHVGALPYVLKQLQVPVWGTRLTLGLVRGKLEEHGLAGDVKLNEVTPGTRVGIGPFDLEMIRVTHSIPDAVCLALRTPLGVILHTSDYKFDPTPIDGQLTDFASLSSLGDEGVLALVTDTTNIEKPGHTPSERTVGATLDAIFRDAQRRVIVASFASNVHRIQQVLDVSARHGRKVVVLGRSMASTVRVAAELGYLRNTADTLVPIDELDRLPPNEITVLTTGSQGEPLSALSRIAEDEHKKIRLEPGDTVIISAHPIPGNEDLVLRTINNLFRRGATVFYDTIAPVHVSGHGNAEELRLMLNIARPVYLVPVHGETRHMVHYRNMAIREMGYPEHSVFLLEMGDCLRFTAEGAEVVGRVPAGMVLVDGIGLGDVGDVVLRDRRHLSQDGVVIITAAVDMQTGEVLAGPDIISRGFVYERESEELLEEARQRVIQGLSEAVSQTTEMSTLKGAVKKSASKLLYERTGRRPVVLPIILEV